MIFAILWCAQSGAGWLNEYFRAEEQFSWFKIEAVRKLGECEDSIDCGVWEESVRGKTMDEQRCREAKELEKCIYSAYQDPVAEYIKLLMQDARELCKMNRGERIPDERCEWCMLIIPFAFCFGLGFVAVVVYLITRKKRGTFEGVEAGESFHTCDECDELSC